MTPVDRSTGGGWGRADLPTFPSQPHGREPLRARLRRTADRRAQQNAAPPQGGEAHPAGDPSRAPSPGPRGGGPAGGSSRDGRRDSGSGAGGAARGSRGDGLYDSAAPAGAQRGRDGGGPPAGNGRPRSGGAVPSSVRYSDRAPTVDPDRTPALGTGRGPVGAPDAGRRGSRREDAPRGDGLYSAGPRSGGPRPDRGRRDAQQPGADGRSGGRRPAPAPRQAHGRPPPPDVETADTVPLRTVNAASAVDRTSVIPLETDRTLRIDTSVPGAPTAHPRNPNVRTVPRQGSNRLPPMREPTMPWEFHEPAPDENGRSAPRPRQPEAPSKPPAPQEPFWPVLTRLFLAVLIAFTGLGVVIPAIPPYVLDELGGSAFLVGVAFALSGFVALLVRPYAGQFAQRWGSRRVMFVGILVAVLCGALYAAPFGLAALFGARLVMGLAESAIFTAGSVRVVAVAPADRRGQLVGYYGLAMWGGWTLGPVLGTFLLGFGGYRLVWAAAVALPVFAAAVLLTMSADRPIGGAVSRRLVPAAVVVPGTAILLAAFGYSALTGFVVLHLDAKGITDGASIIGVFGVVYVSVRIVAGRLPDRVGPGIVAAFCGVGEATGLVILGTAQTWIQAAIGAAVLGAGFTLLYPALALLVIRRSKPAEQGAALGAYTSFWDLGLGVAGLIGGAIALVGYPYVFYFAAGCALLTMFAGVLSRGPKPE
ncbi:MFS transporter [Virgisporangium aliadipatigenens]|uniref:MFS transporter n=1 Tax=Virgisporangium aliadipatigenens TaxID=741659 RepID=UPI0019434421|nr:MFS transporter [Virgisporangium aliadipatigenens]